jgi:hypothetical protein
LESVTLLALGLPVIFVVPFLILKLAGTRPPPATDTPARRVYLAVGVSLGACILIGIIFRFAFSGMQVFEASGNARLLSLPLGYFVFGIALLASFKGSQGSFHIPAWWSLLVLIVVASTLLAVLDPRQAQSATAALEGLAFAGGFLLAALLGLRAGRWTVQEERQFLLVLGTFACLAGFLNLSINPYIALVIPGATFMIYASRRVTSKRFLLLLLGAALALVTIIPLLQATAPSSSALTQGAVCIVLLLLLLLPRNVRLPLALVGGVVAIWLAFRAGLIDLLLGDGSSATDVTLTHRAYEAGMVLQGMNESVITFLIGLGPAATVDLTMSPDARTLASSGRMLVAVDDVHFLTSWMLLKFGLVGLLWFLAMLIVCVREAAHILSADRPSIFDAAMLLFVAAGVVGSLAAGTYFFSNPLPAMLLGVMYARRKSGSRSTAIATKSSILSRSTQVKPTNAKSGIA